MSVWTVMRLHVLVEGQTEEAFVKRVLMPGAVEGELVSTLDLDVRPGSEVRVSATFYLENLEEEPMELWGGAHFALSAAHDTEVLTIVDASHDETEFAAATECFQITSVARDGRGVVSAVPFDVCGDASLLDDRISIVQAEYVLTAPHGVEQMGEAIEARIWFEDGLAGEGQPVPNIVSAPDGRTYRPCFRELLVRFHVLDDEPFIRGDANYDGLINISDAVSLLRTLFEPSGSTSDAPVRCESAGDANDDSNLDVSDAVFVFQYLFAGGREPPAPFPVEGADPTPDGLRCEP